MPIIHRIHGSALAHGPEPAGFVAADAHDPIGSGSGRKGYLLETAFFKARKRPGFLTDPECSPRVFKETRHAVVCEFRGIRRIENLKPFSIKSREAAMRSEPEIPVAALNRGRYCILRETIFRPPDAN